MTRSFRIEQSVANHTPEFHPFSGERDSTIMHALGQRGRPSDLTAHSGAFRHGMSAADCASEESP
jgi:hypothetical protein